MQRLSTRLLIGTAFNGPAGTTPDGIHPGCTGISTTNTYNAKDFKAYTQTRKANQGR